MGRERRVQVPGGIYHVMCRGVRRTVLFRSPRDYEHILSLFAIVSKRRGWRCLANCLMPNHYHLLFETPEPDLSLGMHRVNSGYARWFNERYGQFGHVFEARFKSVLVERDEHLIQLARYIALNPVRAGLCESPAEWPWSSYRIVAGFDEAPSWFDVGFWSEVFGPPRAPDRARAAYREFVASG